MNIRKMFVSALAIAATLFMTSESALADSVTYSFTMNTSSLSGQQGYIDLQFITSTVTSGGGLTAYNPTGTATLFNFQTDGSVPTNDPYGNGGAYGDISGNLASGITFSLLGDGALPEYDQLLTFGNELSFDVTLAGQAVTAPICPANRAGTECSGAGFLLDFYDPTASNYLFTGDPSGSDGDDWITGGITVNLDTTTSTYTNPGPNGGPSDLTITSGVAPVVTPEPSSWALLGTGLFGVTALRRRVSVG